MNIRRLHRNTQQSSNALSIPSVKNSKYEETSFTITSVHYGRLITGAAMRNILGRDSFVSNYDRLGIIAYQLIDDESKTFDLKIDSENKKLSIVGCFQLMMNEGYEINTTLKFEWDFRE